MKNKFQKLIVGMFAFITCMCITTTIVKAGAIGLSTERVSDDQYFIMTVSVGDGELYDEPKFSLNEASCEFIKTEGGMKYYKVYFTDAIEGPEVMEILIPGKGGTSDLRRTIEAFWHGETDQSILDAYGTEGRGGGLPNPDFDGYGGEDYVDADGDGRNDNINWEGSGVYGDPEDLAHILSPNGGVGEVIFDFFKLVAVILTFGCLCFLGVNLMINREKAEDRASTMTGFKFIAIGVLLLDVVLLIYTLVDGLMGNQEDEVAEFGSPQEAIVCNFEEI